MLTTSTPVLCSSLEVKMHDLVWAVTLSPRHWGIFCGTLKEPVVLYSQQSDTVGFIRCMLISFRDAEAALCLWSRKEHVPICANYRPLKELPFQSWLMCGAAVPAVTVLSGHRPSRCTGLQTMRSHSSKARLPSNRHWSLVLSKTYSDLRLLTGVKLCMSSVSYRALFFKVGELGNVVFRVLDFQPGCTGLYPPCPSWTRCPTATCYLVLTPCFWIHGKTFWTL